MGESSHNFPTSEINPYETPAAEATEAEPLGDFVPPSLQLVGICVGVGMGLTFLLWVLMGNWSSDSPIRTAFWIVGGALLGGTTSGLGVALLIQAVRLQQFSALMPGHWRLIAWVATLTGQSAWVAWALIRSVAPVPDPVGINFWLINGCHGLLGAILYCVILRTTNETRIWRIYAWICVLYDLVLLPQAVILPLVIVADWRQLISSLQGVVIASNLLAVAAIVVFVIAVVWDYRKRIPRDGYHYLGLAFPAAASLMSWLLRVAYQLL